MFEDMTSEPARQYLISMTTTIVDDYTRCFAMEPNRARTQRGHDITHTSSGIIRRGRRCDRFTPPPASQRRRRRPAV